jgi:hypothetical protein
MTRMLYTAAMNAKLSVPDEVDPGTREFSFRAQWRVNHWAYAGILLSIAGDLLVHCQKEALSWPVAVRTGIALCPAVPGLLWLRCFRRWLRGMDELGRQITLKVCLFAISATLYLDMGLPPLGKWGVLPAGWFQQDWQSWWFQAVLLSFFYILGARIFNRRYK